jgi:hypothetical protein
MEAVVAEYTGGCEGIAGYNTAARAKRKCLIVSQRFEKGLSLHAVAS